MASQSGGPSGTVPVTHLASLLSISSIHHRSSQRSATKDPSDVSALSCQGIGPLSTPLQDGLRFFRPPMPAPPSARLTARFPPPGVRIRGFQVPLVEYIGVGACSRPGGHGPRYSHQKGNIPPPLPFWLEPDNLFGSFIVTTVTQIRIRSPCRLSNLLPGRGFQEGTPLAIGSPHVFDMLRRIVPAALHSGR